MLLLLTPELQKKSFTVAVAEKVRLPVNAVMRDRSRTIVTNSIADGERASGSINDKTKASHVKRKHRKKMSARCVFGCPNTSCLTRLRLSRQGCVPPPVQPPAVGADIASSAYQHHKNVLAFHPAQRRLRSPLQTIDHIMETKEGRI
ncbi:hypothetical protein RLO149_c018860 [Roseobacter litoralis Och 149]|uniref:Uncharacterized protein n=1 Tax=Roseobacter litoralis (strain ATCC 49566 / DSM 6996 / JCM 21268 / NBRC 15278 / OCh 149) TaxID=391595 RepID=F7ZJP3_ROSLO|nr:hypothetical protein RLO149_c018860 [Roseobacter litoralis Och 149]